MATDVVMPKMGFDMEEGTILRWAKAEGDDVQKGDVLAEIETGKVTIEIEAFDAGVLRRILVQEGTTVPVGTPIAIVGTADEEIVEPAAPAPKADGNRVADRANGKGRAGSDRPVETATGGQEAGRAEGRMEGLAESPTEGRSEGDGAGEDAGRLRASPLARRMAAEHELDLGAIAPGSGPHGRVVRDDVAAAVREGPPERRTAGAAPAGVGPGGPARREKLSRMREIVARRLGESWQAAPHIFLTMAVDTEALHAARAEINADLEAAGGGAISLNDLIVKASAVALRRHPALNASYDAGERVLHAQVHVGVAVALPDGLITLTVADADVRPVTAIAAEIRDKAERARAGKLTAEDFTTGSTFTVSNLGMYGIEEFTAIINPPEAAILAVGTSEPRAVVRDGAVVARRTMKITLSADHRVVDGATAAEFLATLRNLLEHPLVALA